MSAATLDTILERITMLEPSPRPPPPRDLEAERVLITALFERLAPPHVLARIDPRDFYAPLHHEIVDRVREGRKLGELEAATARLVGQTPTVLGRRLDETIASVQRLARCRRALERVELAAARLRNHDPDVVPLLIQAADEVSDG